jgi:peptide chain release factor 2
MIKDHRTGEETSNVDAVLDGDIDRFIMPTLNGSTRNRRKKPEEVL